MAINRDALDAVVGWLSPQARELTERLVGLQNRLEYTTAVLEFGVFKGKYLALLAGLTASRDVPVVGVDAFLERAGVKLIPEHRASAEAEIHASVQAVTGAESAVKLIGGYTREIRPSELQKLAPTGYSFISVDAGHDADDLLTDCPIVEKLLSEKGVAAFDDVFNPVTPGVGEGFFKFFGQGTSDLAPFATCGNKVFMSRSGAYREYYDLCMEIALSAESEIPELANSTRHVKGNQDNSWEPRLFGFPIVPLL